MNFLSFKARTICFSLVGLSTLGALAMLGPDSVLATPPTPGSAPSVAAPQGSAEADAGVSSQSPTTATIVFSTSPPVTAMVFWGKKNIGKITAGRPLVVVRPRDSGPLDVVVRTKNYLPVQTRAHTFADQRVVVKLTPPDKMNELLGYKAPLDAGVDQSEAAALEAMADGGVNNVPPASAPFQVVPSAPSPVPIMPAMPLTP